MEQKKGTTILLAVIGIATLLVALVGATFAYFTATVNETGTTDKNVTIQTATLGNVTFDQGAVVSLGAENAYPNAVSSKTFSVEATAGTVDYNYSVFMSVLPLQEGEQAFSANTALGTDITNLQYQLCLVTDTDQCTAAKDNAWTNIKTTDSKITLVDNATMDVQEKTAVTHNYVVWVRLNEIEDAQNYDQGRTFRGELSVEVANLDENTGYTTDDSGAKITTSVASAN